MGTKRASPAVLKRHDKLEKMFTMREQPFVNREIKNRLDEAFKGEEEGDFGRAADCFLEASVLVHGLDGIPVEVLEDVTGFWPAIPTTWLRWRSDAGETDGSMIHCP